MSYTEALKLVDQDRCIANMETWSVCAAGFYWSNWIERGRTWTPEDFKRMEERDRNWTPENNLPPTEPTGEYRYQWHIIGTVIVMSPEEHEKFKREAGSEKEWFDCTDAINKALHLHGRPLEEQKADWE